MGENVEDQIQDVDMESTPMVFDNLTILKELSNIANLVRVEDFLETVPKAKIKRVKWVPMFNCLKQGILDEMVQELNDMWVYENIPEKLEILEKQKEKFTEVNKTMWRPELGNVKSQLRAHDVATLQKQKTHLEILAKDYEAKVNKLKKNVSARRGYIKALQLDIQKYQTKNEDFILSINKKIEGHSKLFKQIVQNPENPEDVKWSDNYEEGEL